MKGFIVYPTYRIENGKAYVHLYGRLENGETFLSMHPYRPYFFIRKKDLKEAKKLLKDRELDVKEEELKDFDDEEVVRIVLDNPRNVPDLRDKLHEEGIPTYEADIRFVYRWLIDNGIRGSIDIKGKHEEDSEGRVDRLYRDPDFEPVTWTPELKVLSFDIETDKEGDELFAISVYTDNFRKCLIKKKGSFKDAESFDSEKEILKRFHEVVRKEDPDVITGWNVIDFDLDFLEKKFREHSVPFTLGRTDDKCSLRRYGAWMRDSSADFPGRQVLDGIHLMRISFVRMDDWKLDTAAEKYLGEKKLIEGKDKYKRIKDAYENKPQKLVDYNLKDARLVYDILEESGVLDLTIQRSLIAGMQLDRVKASVASLDNLYLHELRKRGYVAGTRDYQERERRITGGFVMESKPGIFDYVIVCDFKSLYPSIMRTFNIDPLMYVPPNKEKNYKDLIEAPNGAKFRREEGIIPSMIQQLWARRNKAKKDRNDLESYAIKVLMNSMFGVLANPNCRFYSFDMANAITHFGQHFIKLSAERIRDKGYDVIYGDTDSLFIDLDVDNYEESQEIGKEIQDYINELFDKHIKEEYGVESYLELEFEKTYKRFFMPKTRSGEGAKKRYAGIIVSNGKEGMEFVGLEFVRRDWTDLAKEFQQGLISKVFDRKNPDDFIRKFVDDLRKGKHDHHLVYRKALRKSPDEYTKTTPPHVKAARKMDTIQSSVIEYVMTVAGPEPADDIQHTIDYDHYVDKQIKPLANQVLRFFNTKFDDVLKGTKQTKLDGF